MNELAEMNEESMMGDVDDIFTGSFEAGMGENQLICGIAAMEKKCSSKPMQQILGRLARFEHIEVLVFPESTILNEPPEAWPICDAFLSFYSNGFPLEKAIAYAKLRKPWLVNDLETQLLLQDRQKVHETLAAAGVELPRYAVLIRDPLRPDDANIVEHDDWIEIGDQVFHKPFVEKPLSAEDHNVYIYYPSSAGGGSQRLFRKIGSRSSVYSSESRIRRQGSYIYEEFTPTDGTDVKVYTVGPDYAHAEARKSPALDGKVDRDADGKEIRYPVILSAREKIISRSIVLAFSQNVCGFDLLRTNGKTYVCDVNGFSFVKNSNKYYDDCAKILGNMIMRELGEKKGIPWANAIQIDEDCPIVPTTSGAMMELRCVTAVLRHGDRTPKQKMKMEIRHPKFFEIFAKYGGYTKGNVKLKHPTQLQEILDLTRFLLREMDEGGNHADNIEEKRGKLMQMVVVLELYGHFSGVYRKCILRFPKSSNNAGGSAPASMTNSTVNVLPSSGSATSHFSPMAQLQQQQLLQQQQQQQLQPPSISASSSTTQFANDGSTQPQQPQQQLSTSTRGSLLLSSADESTCSPNEEDDRPRLELVLKWGGELTPAGRIQAEELGKAFRKLYPDTTGSQNRHSESDEDIGGGGGAGDDDDDDGGWRFDDDDDDAAGTGTSASTAVEIGAAGAISVVGSGSDSTLSPSRRQRSSTRKIERRSSFPKCHDSVSSKESLDDDHEDVDSATSSSTAAAAAAAYRRGMSAPATRRSRKRRNRAKSDDGDLGLGLLRLQSTFRHDLKIYASDEGRVQMTAAAFTKGLLDLEGELTPILVQMVKSANTNGLLDNDSQVARQQNVVKARLHTALQKNEDFDAQDYEILARGGSLGSRSIYKAMKFVRNPTKMCERIANLIADMLDVIRTKKEDPKCQNDVLYHQESWDLMYRRWEKLKKDFKMKNGKYDISKVPDIYDCIKYDYQHNQRYLEFKRAQEFFTCSKALADLVIPLEYGISKEEKLDIGQGILTPLLRKIRMDFQRVIENDFDLDDCSRLDPRYSNYRYTRGIQSPYRHVRTRLYFTSESHIHSLLNVIQFGGLCDESADPQWRRAMEYLSAVSELNYLTQIVIMLYEDPRQEPTSEERFHVELHFSAGAITGILEKNIRSYSLEIGGSASSSSSVASSAGGPGPTMKRCPTDPTDFVQRHRSPQQQQQQQPPPQQQHHPHQTSPMSEYLKARVSPVSPLSRSWDSKSPTVLPAVSEETSTGASTPSAGSTSGSIKALEKQDSKDSATIVLPKDPPVTASASGGSSGAAAAAAAASFSIAFDLDSSPSPSSREVDGRFHVETLDSAKKKLTNLANEKIEKPTSLITSPRNKGVSGGDGGGSVDGGCATTGGGASTVMRGQQGRAASKSDADRHAAFLFSNEKNAPYATFHGVSTLSRMQPTTPWTSLFSTKLLTGSSSAPNLLDLDYVTAASLNEKLLTCGEGIPSIRPLETLHCSLSLRQLDRFMEKVTDPAFRNFSSSSTPQSSPPSARGKSALSMANLATTSTSGQKPVITSTSSPANIITASATCSQPIPTASPRMSMVMAASADDASMTSLTGSPVSMRDPMTSSLNSLANASSPRDSRSNSPTIVGPDLSFCSEGVVRMSAESAYATSTTSPVSITAATMSATPMILDEDSNTRESMMQLEENE